MSEIDPLGQRFSNIDVTKLTDDPAALIASCVAATKDEKAELLGPYEGKRLTNGSRSGGQRLSGIITQFASEIGQELDDGEMLEITHNLRLIERALKQNLREHSCGGYLSSVEFKDKERTVALLQRSQPIYTLRNQELRDLLDGLSEAVKAIRQAVVQPNGGLSAERAKVLQQAILREMLMLIAEAHVRATGKYPMWHQVASLMIAFNNPDSNILEQLVTGGGKTIISHIMVALEHYWGRLPVTTSANADLAATSCAEFKPLGRLLGLTASQNLADEADIIFTTGSDYTANKRVLHDRNMEVAVIIDEVDTVSLDATHMVKVVEQEDPNADPNSINPDAPVYGRLSDAYTKWYEAKGLAFGQHELLPEDVSELVGRIKASVPGASLDRVLTRIQLDGVDGDEVALREKKIQRLVVSMARSFSMLSTEPRQFQFRVDENGRISYEIIELGNVQKNSCFEDPDHQLLIAFGTRRINEWLAQSDTPCPFDEFNEKQLARLRQLGRVTAMIGPYNRAVVSALQNQSLVETKAGAMRAVGEKTAVREARVVGFSGTVKMYGGTSDRAARELYGAKLVTVPMPKAKILENPPVLTTKLDDSLIGLLQQCEAAVSNKSRTTKRLGGQAVKEQAGLAAWLYTDDQYKMNALLRRVMQLEVKPLVAVRGMGGYTLYRDGQLAGIATGKQDLLNIVAQATTPVVVLSNEQLKPTEQGNLHYIVDNERVRHRQQIGEELTKQIEAQHANLDAQVDNSTFLILREEAKEVEETAKIVRELPICNGRYVVVKTERPVGADEIGKNGTQAGDVLYDVYGPDGELQSSFAQKLLPGIVKGLIGDKAHRDVVIVSDFSVGRGTDLSLVKNEIIGDLVRDKADVMQMVGRVDRENKGHGQVAKLITNTSVIRALGSVENDGEILVDPVASSAVLHSLSSEKLDDKIEEYLQARLESRAGQIATESVLEAANSVVQQYFEEGLTQLQEQLSGLVMQGHRLQELFEQCSKYVKDKLIGRLGSLRSEYAVRIDSIDPHTLDNPAYVALLEGMRDSLVGMGRRHLELFKEQLQLAVQEDREVIVSRDEWLLSLVDPLFGSVSTVGLLDDITSFNRELQKSLVGSNYVSLDVLRNRARGLLLAKMDEIFSARARDLEAQAYLDVAEGELEQLFENGVLETHEDISSIRWMDALRALVNKRQDWLDGQTASVDAEIWAGLLDRQIAELVSQGGFVEKRFFHSLEEDQGKLTVWLRRQIATIDNQLRETKRETLEEQWMAAVDDHSDELLEKIRRLDALFNGMTILDSRTLENSITGLCNQNLISKPQQIGDLLSVNPYITAWNRDGNEKIAFELGDLREEILRDPGLDAGEKMAGIFDRALWADGRDPDAIRSAGDYISLGIGVASSLASTGRASDYNCRVLLQAARAREEPEITSWLRRCTTFGALSYNYRLQVGKTRKVTDTISPHGERVKQLLFSGTSAVNPVTMSRGDKNDILDECRLLMLQAMRSALLSGQQQDRQLVRELLTVCNSMPSMEDLSPELMERHSKFMVMVSALNIHRSSWGTPLFMQKLTRTGRLLKNLANQLEPQLTVIDGLANDGQAMDEKVLAGIAKNFNRLANKVTGGSGMRLTTEQVFHPVNSVEEQALENAAGADLQGP